MCINIYIVWSQLGVIKEMRFNVVDTTVSIFQTFGFMTTVCNSAKSTNSATRSGSQISG